MKEKGRGFNFDFKKEEVRVMDPDETDTLRQLMKTDLMQPICPKMIYVIPGSVLIKLINQISVLKTRLKKYEKG